MIFSRPFSTLAAAALLGGAALPLWAQTTPLQEAETLCAAAMTGALSTLEGLAPESAGSPHPFGTMAYSGTWDDRAVTVSMGDKFGSTLCELWYPEAGETDYEALQAPLQARFGTGTVYDGAVSGAGYRGEIWTDDSVFDDGTVSDMTLGDMDLGSVMVQWADAPSGQTNDRAGLMVEMTAR